MANDLAIFEPIPAPDLKRLNSTPQWPGWLVRSSVAVRSELQTNPQTKKFADVLVLPAELMPTPAQRCAIENHRDNLRSYLNQTPELDQSAETRTAAAVTKLLLVLPSMKRTDIGEEARSEVYLDVLDDVPCWAVENAVRRWHRHECGVDERGRPYDYKWAPDPGTLRRVAMSARYELLGRIVQLDRVLSCVAYVDCTHELELGKAAMRGLFKCLGDKEALASLTWEQGIKLGLDEAASAPAQEAAE